MIYALADEMRRHMVDSFSDSVVKGMDYGEVDAVMIGADIYGWALTASSSRLPDVDRIRLRRAAE